MANWTRLVTDGRLTNLGLSLIDEGHRAMQPQSNIYHIAGGPVINFESVRKIRQVESGAMILAHNNNEHALQISIPPESVGKLLWAWHCWCYANGRQCLTE
jgi:hypothetical protein